MASRTQRAGERGLRSRLMGMAILVMAWCGTAAADPPPLADMNEVRAELGLPQGIRFLPGGEESWEYTRKVRQRGAWRYIFEPSGRVREVQPMRTPGDVAAVAVSETHASEVVGLLGNPDRIVPEGDTVAWQFGLPERGTLILRFAAGKFVADKQVLP